MFAVQVKYEVFKCLSSLHTKNAEESQRPFPYLRTLLRSGLTRAYGANLCAFPHPERNDTTFWLYSLRLITGICTLSDILKGMNIFFWLYS